jgi:hypothetical protein
LLICFRFDRFGLLVCRMHFPDPAPPFPWVRFLGGFIRWLWCMLDYSLSASADTQPGLYRRQQRIKRIRIDRESEASHDLIRLLNKPDMEE